MNMSLFSYQIRDEAGSEGAVVLSLLRPRFEVTRNVDTGQNTLPMGVLQGRPHYAKSNLLEVCFAKYLVNPCLLRSSTNRPHKDNNNHQDRLLQPYRQHWISGSWVRVNFGEGLIY